MKIRTRVKIAGALAFGVLLAYGAWAVHSHRAMNRMVWEVKEAQEITNRIFMLRTLVNDFLFFPTDRAQRQWSAVYEELLRLLDEPEYRKLQGNYGIADTADSLKSVELTFSRLRRLQETSGRDAPEAAEMQNRLRTQLMLTTQDIVSKTSRMDDEIIAKLTAIQRVESAFDLLSIMVLGIITISAGVFLQRSVVKPVLQLHEGAEIIGAGNLDHKMGINTRDEVGELARAFDRMTANLQQVTVSRDELSREIEERQRAEATLRESEERARRQLAEIESIYSSAPVGLCVFDRELRYVRINDRLAEINGPPAEAHLGRTPREVVPDLGDQAEKLLNHILETGQPILDVEFTGTTPAQPEVLRTWIEQWMPLKDGAGKVIGISVAAEEITERKRTETALRESEERFRKIFENAATGITITDLEGRFQRCNPAYCALLGYTEDEFRHLEFASLIHPEDREANLAEIQRLQAGEVPFFEIENRYLRKDSVPVWVRKFVSLLPDPTGKPAHFVALVTDVTERKRAHEVLEQQVAERTAVLRHTVEQLQWEIGERQQVEEALRESEKRLRYLASQLLTAQETERKRLALELHDDLGQSLMVLKMQLQAVDRMLPAKQSKAKDGLANSLKNINEVVENVRRMCHDLLPPVLEDLGLKVALEQLLKKFGEHAGISLSWDLDDLGGVFFPEAKISIYRIMQESLTNISKHAQATQIKVAVKRQEGKVAFRVEDNGKGFDLQEVLYGDVPKRGLGLNAMYERVRLLGGELHISSEPGTGTKLFFIVPTNS